MPGPALGPMDKKMKETQLLPSRISALGGVVHANNHLHTMNNRGLDRVSQLHTGDDR